MTNDYVLRTSFFLVHPVDVWVYHLAEEDGVDWHGAAHDDAAEEAEQDVRPLGQVHPHHAHGVHLRPPIRGEHGVT